MKSIMKSETIKSAQQSSHQKQTEAFSCIQVYD
jgi:hypothetical protein